MTTPLIKQLDDDLGILLRIGNTPDTRRRAALILHTLRIEYLYMSSLVGRLPPLDLCYFIRLECTRTNTLIASYRNELRAVVSLIKTLKENAYTIIEE
jgi:hypothetical protein